MTKKLSKRCIVRITAFSIAIALLIIAWISVLSVRAKKAELALEYSYLRAVENLSNSATNINTSLQKGLYAGTGEMLSSISDDLMLDASSAKTSLSELSIPEVSLEGTSKFFSQVGNFAESLSEKLSKGEKITNEEYNSFEKLYEYSEKLKNNINKIESYLSSSGNEISYETVSKISSIDEKSLEESEDISVTFSDIEEEFENYPSLIYDGPFSDHILEKNPEMTKGKKTVTQKEAKQRASEVSLVQESNLKLVNKEDGKMPSYIFEGNGATVAVTKQGGFCSYVIKNREVNELKIENEEAVEIANGYLAELGIYEMEPTYYETIGNVCTINFAFKENDVIYYTDLIKVEVALDNGEILGFDARGFIVNHKTRKLNNPKIEMDDGKKKLSPKLTVTGVQKALIPNDSDNEILCYEYKCKTEDSKNVLVYINCETGKEEQILILIESKSGVLTV